MGSTTNVKAHPSTASVPTSYYSSGTIIASAKAKLQIQATSLHAPSLATFKKRLKTYEVLL